MEKSDYRKELKDLYGPSQKQVTVVDPPEMLFLMMDGEGDPATSGEYHTAVETLFAVSYALKFMIRKSGLQVDYAVFPLESLWWADDMSAFTLAARDRWKWTAMIAQPKYVTRDLFEDATVQVERKKSLPIAGKLRLESFHEGRAAQIMHLGSFADEGRTVAMIHRFIADSGHNLAGKHHEIYLSDFRRTAPEKLRTVIRQPFK